MSNVKCTDARPRELGAISIKAVLMLLFVAIVAFMVIKIAPVYVDERQVTYKVEDLANKSAVRNSKEVDINKAIEAIRKEYDLPENSIALVSREQAGKIVGNVGGHQQGGRDRQHVSPGQVGGRGDPKRSGERFRGPQPKWSFEECENAVVEGSYGGDPISARRRQDRQPHENVRKVQNEHRRYSRVRDNPL